MSHVAFMIATHHNPVQTGRLVRRLAAPGARVYVHVDAKTPLKPFRDACGEHAVVLDRQLDANWGTPGLMNATVMMVDRALADDPSHLCLLSGQDYPIKPIARIVETIRAADAEMMEIVPMTEERSAKPIWRLNYRIQPTHVVGRTWARRLRLAFHLLNRALPRRDLHAMVGPMRFYGGATWWCVTAATMRRMRVLHAEMPGLLALHQHGHIPDESFWQTSLMAAAPERPVLRDPTFVKWERSRGETESPEIWTVADAPVLARSERLFARKFDPRCDAEILDLLDRLEFDSEALNRVSRGVEATAVARSPVRPRPIPILSVGTR